VSRRIQEGKIMSYTVATPGGKVAPATVMAASALLFVCAAIEVVNGVLGLLVIGPTRDLLNNELKNTPGADAAATFATVGAIVGIVIAIILIAAMVTLGVLLRQGKNPARIVTWVLGGLGVLCYGCTLSASAAGNALSGMAAANQSSDSAELQRRIQDVIPGWQTAVSTILTVVLLLAFVAVIILLMLPASNNFFRTEVEVWVPPTVPAGGFVPPQATAPIAPYVPPAMPPAAPPAPSVPPSDPSSPPPPAPPAPPA
jgi:hypothetical protein